MQVTARVHYEAHSNNLENALKREGHDEEWLCSIVYKLVYGTTLALRLVISNTQKERVDHDQRDDKLVESLVSYYPDHALSKLRFAWEQVQRSLRVRELLAVHLEHARLRVVSLVATVCLLLLILVLTFLVFDHVSEALEVSLVPRSSSGGLSLLVNAVSLFAGRSTTVGVVVLLVVRGLLNSCLVVVCLSTSLPSPGRLFEVLFEPNLHRLLLILLSI